MADVVCIDEETERDENYRKKQSEIEDRFPLLPYETNLMIDTFVEDALFIVGRGLGIEQLFLNHLHLYSDRRSTVLVINTTADDEHYFVEKLKAVHKSCPPKIMTADVLSKDRELIYGVGGVQFITSRILMVDLLTDRVPLDKVAGILVYRAHETLSSFQESFILRLFREKKKDGFVKAFTDDPYRITSAGMGQLQRLVDKLYVKRVVIVPRFDIGVKNCFDLNPIKFMQVSLELPPNQRKIRTLLKDIMNTCVRELKVCSQGLDFDKESDALAPTTGLQPTRLETDLRKKTLLLSEKQERVLTDLHMLRLLLHKIEDMDPTNAWSFICKIRADKDVIEKNSGWIFTPTASTVFSSAESLVFVKDSNGYRTITAPAKWTGLNVVLDELSSKLLRQQKDSAEVSPVLVLVSNENTSRQLIDLVKFGKDRLCYMLTKSSGGLTRNDFLGPEPGIQPMWNSVNVVFYDTQLMEQDRVDLMNQVKELQKKAGRDTRKRGAKKLLEEQKNQPKLAKFGITHYSTERTIKKIEIGQYEKRRMPLAREIVPEGMLPEDPLTDHYIKQEQEEDKDEEHVIEEVQFAEEVEKETIGVEPEESCSSAQSSDKSNGIYGKSGTNVNELTSMLVFLALGNRYNLLNCLENLRPSHIILHNSDIVTTRIIETFKAHNPEHPLEIHALMYTDTTEEERYLVSIQREQSAFELLIREQGVLMVPTEYNVARDCASQLRKITLKRDSRFSQPTAKEIQTRIVTDMREFNSELPTVLYCRGIDLQPATLEVGDYVLSDEICVERKALDDLAQSLHNGRVFKQTEQMLRNYPKSILLIESSEKFRQRRVNGGPFQGELSRRSRETRALLTMLIRSHPQLSILWSFSPSHSAELFEEIKLDQPNPDVELAISIRGDDTYADRNNAEERLLAAAENENEIPDANSMPASKGKSRLNAALKRQLLNLPGMLSGDVERLMKNCDAGIADEEGSSIPNLNQLVQTPVENILKLLLNQKQAEDLKHFFQIDFRLAPT